MANGSNGTDWEFVLQATGSCFYFVMLICNESAMSSTQYVATTVDKQSR